MHGYFDKLIPEQKLISREGALRRDYDLPLEQEAPDRSRAGLITLNAIENVAMRADAEDLQDSRQLITLGLSAAVFAHELSNQIGGIALAVQSLKREIAMNGIQECDRILSALDGIKDSIDHLGSLLNEFRELAHGPRLKFERADLSGLVAELLALERPQYAARGIRVEFSLAPDLPPVTIDKDKFKQALLNLCKNAAEAMPNGGTLSLKAYRSGRNVSFDIIDTGTGVPEGLDIFQLFVTTKPDGTGLGLAIVRQIISAHGGTVEYDSRPGEGTVFRLTLPLGTSSR
jgi:signal transduction histidine kinase